MNPANPARAYLEGRDAERWTRALSRMGPQASRRRHQRCVNLAMQRIGRLRQDPGDGAFLDAIRALELATTSGIATGLESGRQFTLKQLGIDEDRD